MRSLVFFVALIGAEVVLAQHALRYKLEPIKDVSAGALGSKRLFFDLECNQKFLQVLKQPQTEDALKVGILTGFSDTACDKPAQRTYVRFSPHGKNMIFVVDFEQVWECRGMCFTPSGPDMPPYNRVVQAYGTSQAQAVESLGCSEPYLQRLQCSELEFIME